MAKLTTQEVLDGLAALYQAKQDVSALDEDLNTQAAAIMAQAQAQVQALKDGQAVARAQAQDAITQAEQRLTKGK